MTAMGDSCIDVLLLEDNPGDAFLVEQMLKLTELNQFQLTHVERLRSATHRLSKETFDIILLDLGLPDSQGLDALIAVNTQAPHLPVVILTGLGDEKLAFQAVQQGAQDYLVKGQVTAEVLVRTIRYAIERKRAEEALKQAKAAAEAGNRAKSKFLASMSHELRTPLNVILGFTQILNQDHSLNPKQKEHLDIILRSGEHLLSLINDILDMSKIEAGRTKVTLNHFDLYGLLNILEEMFQLRAQSKGLQLIFDRATDVPQYVQTDESKLRQVLINLLSNAVKFTLEGNVTLRVSFTPHPTLRTSPTLHFEIEDTGPGIAPTELNNLFEAFMQTQTGRQMGQGTGLGLAISQQLVRLLEGEIRVSSSLGHGSRFQFEIPIHLSASNNIQSPQLTQRIVALEPGQPIYRLLVVDDRWSNRKLLVTLLEPLGFEVREAENGQEAVALWESWKPHLIWMDMRMPVMDGYEATQKIKAQLKGQATVIIALTASVFEQEKAEVLSSGCNDFVHKPFQSAVIFEKLIQYLGVRYVYENDVNQNKASIPSQPLKELQAEAVIGSLASMPIEWLATFNEAAVVAKAEPILQLIEQIPQTQTALAEALVELVNNFHWDRIQNLVQQTGRLPPSQ